MTVLEELIDMALKVCERISTISGSNKLRSAVILGKNGKAYHGCDLALNTKEVQGISGERAAILNAVADGVTEFEVGLSLLSAL
jgi:cytidine deaminase